MSYHSNRKKRAAISAICISIAMLTAQQVPAAALLQEPGLSRDSMAKTPEAVTQQLLAAESSQILQNSTQQLPAAESSQIPQDSTQQLPAAESSGQIPESSTQQPENGDLQQLPAAGDSQENMDIPQEEAGNSTQARIYAKTSSQLPAPKTLQVQALGYNTVTLAWSAVDGAAGYQIEYASDAAHAGTAQDMAGKSDAADAKGTGRVPDAEPGPDAADGRAVTQQPEYVVAGSVPKGVVTFKCTPLLTGTAYIFRVCALDGTGKTGNYASVTAQPCLDKTKFTNVSSAQNAVSLEWEQVDGAEKYELYRKAAGQKDYELLAETEGLSYTDKTAAAGEAYSYCVCAVRSVGGTVAKAELSDPAEISPKEPKPSKPGTAKGVQFESASASAYNAAKLAWTQDSSASGYYIYRSVKENGTYRKIKTITSSSTLAYTDKKIVPGKKFYYKVCTYTKQADGTVKTGDLSESVSVQPQAEAPKLNSVKTNISNRSLSLEWEKAAGASGYRVYRSLYPDKGFKKIAERPSGTFVGYEDRAVMPGGTYYYRIKTLYKSGSYKGLSKASVILEGNLTPAAPIGLSVSQTDSDTLQISWNSSPGASAYNLYRAASAKDDYVCIAQGLAENTYTDTGLAGGKTYYYCVSAEGTGGQGLKCRPVKYQVNGVSLNTRTLKLCVGVSKPLEVITICEGEAEWTSDKPEIAQVDSDGVVTGMSYGTATVTAMVEGRSASATVSVTPGIKNGIDVSRWQEDVDWCRVKNSGVDFAFLRISNHDQEDYTFETKYMNASSVGMPLGVYCYSRAVNAEEAREEARIVLEILNGRELQYPVAFDMEDAVHKSKTMTKAKLHEIIKAFQEVIEEAGHDFVLYSYLTFLNSNLDKTKLDGIDLWIARYRNVALGTGYTGTGNVKFWQYNSGQYSGSDFHVDGITDKYGELVPVDVNAEYE